MNTISAYSSDDQIITSLLDTDFYKLTMMQGVLHQYPNAEVEWAFKCRNSEDLVPHIDEIRRQINLLSNLRLTRDEEDYLSSISYFKPDFVRFLKIFRYNPEYVHVEIVDNELSIRMDGPWLHIILFEIVLLAIVSEVRNRHLYPYATVDMAVNRLRDKISDLGQSNSQEILDSFTLADFGTRRRFSKDVQEAVISTMVNEFNGKFVGTSNVDMARRFNLNPIGTMAHEWIMAHQQLGSRLVDSQRAALESWVQEYRGELGTALTDCMTTDVFLRDFDLYFAKLFDGLRHDSGDPIEFGYKCIKRYEELGIDPMTKTLVFSDGLTFDKCIQIIKEFKGKIKVSFGIGTKLTCDLPDIPPLEIVIKMVSCNGGPVAKISDSAGKGMCEDPEYIEYAKKVFDIHQ